MGFDSVRDDGVDSFNVSAGVDTSCGGGVIELVSDILIASRYCNSSTYHLLNTIS